MEAKRTKLDGGGVSLPEDIVFDVLARLPAKVLCRFRCVCKRWRALISDPAFVAAQRSRAGPHVVGVFYRSSPPEVRVVDMDGNVVRVLEITRGTSLPARLDVICVDVIGSSRPDGMIIDPAAGQAFTVFGMSDPYIYSIRYSIRFGRAAPSGTFKVVRVHEPFLWHHDDGGGHLLYDVATIMDSGGGTELSTWRRRSAPPFFTSSDGDHMAIVDGVLYCIACKLEIGGDVDGHDDDKAPLPNRIAAFNLESEEWKAEVINGPTLRHYYEERIALVEIKGTLALVHVHVYADDDMDVNIWLLVDPGKSMWVKEYRTQMPENYYIWPTNLLGVLGDGRILLLVRRLEKEPRQNRTSYPYRDALIFYNPSTKAFTDLGRSWKIDLGIRWYFYTGSLLS